MSEPTYDGDGWKGYGRDLTPGPTWDDWTDFDHGWQPEHWDGPPHPREGGVFGPLDRWLMRWGGYSSEEVEEMSESNKRAVVKRLKEERTEQRTRSREEEPLSKQMGYDDFSDEEEGDDDRGIEQRFRLRRPDRFLGRDRMVERLEKDRNNFNRRQDARVSAFHGRQQARSEAFERREMRRKRAWNRSHPDATPIGSHFHAEGEAKLSKRVSVFSSSGYETLFKKVIGFDDDELVQEKNAAAKWALEKWGMDFTKARDAEGGKLVIDNLATMEPFVIHENIDMEQKSGKGDALVYAGGYKITMTGGNGDLGGEHRDETFRKGDILLYGHYFIDRGEKAASACHFESSRMASPDAKGNVMVRLKLKDHYASNKADAQGDGKMIIAYDNKGSVSVSSTMNF